MIIISSSSHYFCRPDGSISLLFGFENYCITKNHFDAQIQKIVRLKKRKKRLQKMAKLARKKSKK